jgi:hypothetical protein
MGDSRILMTVTEFAMTNDSIVNFGIRVRTKNSGFGFGHSKYF